MLPIWAFRSVHEALEMRPLSLGFAFSGDFFLCFVWCCLFVWVFFCLVFFFFFFFWGGGGLLVFFCFSGDLCFSLATYYMFSRCSLALLVLFSSVLCMFCVFLLFLGVMCFFLDCFFIVFVLPKGL